MYKVQVNEHIVQLQCIYTAGISKTEEGEEERAGGVEAVACASGRPEAQSYLVRGLDARRGQRRH